VVPLCPGVLVVCGGGALVAGGRDDHLMTRTLRADNDVHHTADVSAPIHLSPVLPTIF
jgi:hypothetical protein